MATLQHSRTLGLAKLGVPVVPWSKFLAGGTLETGEAWNPFDWRQGEHVTTIGTTGSGKTTLAMTLFPQRTYRVIVCVKPRDKLMRRIAREEDYLITAEWPPRKDSDRIILWPPNKGSENLDEQAEIIQRALRNIYKEGRWAVYLDELEWLTGDLGLERDVKVLWQHGRSLGLSLVVGAQRPRHLPMLAYDQATHLFLFQNSDRYNRQRMGELGGMDSKRIEWIMAGLPRHVALYVNTRDGTLAVTRCSSRG